MVPIGCFVVVSCIEAWSYSLDSLSLLLGGGVDDDDEEEEEGDDSAGSDLSTGDGDEEVEFDGLSTAAEEDVALARAFLLLWLLLCFFFFLFFLPLRWLGK